jgi:NADPH:quinone reductase-like Zn-dependent oxidoreductase
MKAIRMHGRGGPERLVYEDMPPPHPDQAEVLVRVYATGVIRTELTWDETYQTEAGNPRALPIPGHDVSGVVEKIGPSVTDLALGSEVYGLTAFDRDGAEAEYTIALPSELAPKSRSLDHVQAAAVPLSALTAWQALFDHGGLVAGQTVLIHGAAGGVGVFAVQLARWTGAQVIATASSRHRNLLSELGAKAILPLKEHLGRSIKLGLVDLFLFTGSIFIRLSSSIGSLFRPDIARRQTATREISLVVRVTIRPTCAGYIRQRLGKLDFEYAPILNHCIPMTNVASTSQDKAMEQRSFVRQPRY